MKPGEFADALGKAATLVSPDKAEQVRIIAEVFASSPAATVAATLTKLRKARALAPTAGQPTIDGVLTGLKPLAAFLAEYGKPAFTKDLQATAGFMQEFTGAGVRSFVDDAVAILTRPAPAPPVLNGEVVARHLRRLEQALGDDEAFLIAHRELDQDPSVGKLEIAALAKRFTDTAAKSRSAVLKKILARHRSLLSSRAKSESRAGRSAG